MFKLDPNSGYWRTVAFYTYAETGALEEHQLRVKFRHLKRSEMREMMKPTRLLEDGTERPTSDEDVCAVVVLALQDVGEGAVDVAEAFEIPDLIEIISTDYFKSRREMIEKNLPTPPTTG